MKRLALLAAFLALPLAAQVTVTIKPISIKGAQGALGNSGIGVWTVSLISRYAVPVSVPHETITESFPLLKDLPNQLAEDLLSRSSSNSFWSIVARWGPTVLTAAGAAYGIHGITTGSISQAWIGQGIALAPSVFARATARAPAPSVYFSEFCPDHISLPPFGSTTCYIASGIIKGAATMSAIVEVPGVGTPVIAADTITVDPDLAATRLEKILRARGLDDSQILAMLK
jgi:hypothetical protein